MDQDFDEKFEVFGKLVRGAEKDGGKEKNKPGYWPEVIALYNQARA